MEEISTSCLGAVWRRFSRAAAITARSASGSAFAKNMAAGTPAYTHRSGLGTELRGNIGGMAYRGKRMFCRQVAPHKTGGTDQKILCHMPCPFCC